MVDFLVFLLTNIYHETLELLQCSVCGDASFRPVRSAEEFQLMKSDALSHWKKRTSSRM